MATEKDLKKDTTGLFTAAEKAQAKTICTLYKLGYSAREISAATGLDLDDVQEAIRLGTTEGQRGA